MTTLYFILGMLKMKLLLLPVSHDPREGQTYNGKNQTHRSSRPGFVPFQHSVIG